LREALYVGGLFDHAVWSLIKFRDMKETLKKHLGSGEVFVRVIMFTLRALPALASMDLPVPAQVSDTALDALLMWLQSNGAVTDADVDPFKKRWFEPVVAAKSAAGNSAFNAVKQVVGQCVDGKYGGVDGKTLLALLAKSKASEDLRKHVVDFGEAVAMLAKIAAAGSLARASTLNEAMCALEKLETSWPTASGEDEEFQKCGFLAEAPRAFVTQARTILETKWSNELAVKERLVSKQTKGCLKSIGKLQVDTESKFRSSMKVSSAALAKEQKALGESVDALEEFLRLPGDKLAGDEAKAAAAACDRTRLEGRKTHERIFLASYFYGALTCFRHPATTKADDEGRAQKTKLLNVLKHITKDEAPAGAEAWYGQVLASMRSTSGWEPPASAAPSGQAAAPVGTPSGQAASPSGQGPATKRRRTA